MRGQHYSAGKPMLQLIPPHAILAVARVITEGAKKYSPNNYRLGIPMTELVGSIERHINAWMRGENSDSESHESHIAHAATDCLMLLQMMYDHPECDDRFRQPIFKEVSNANVAKDCRDGPVGILSDDGWHEVVEPKPNPPNFSC